MEKDQITDGRAAMVSAAGEFVVPPIVNLDVTDRKVKP
jgi:hypothetical protein